MPEGSPARAVVATALLLVLAAGAVWGVLQWRAASTAPGPQAAIPEVRTPAPSPPPSPDVEQPPPEPDPPTPPSEPSEEASPESSEEPPDDGPATGPYAAFSPSHQLTHPDTDPDIRRWYDWFGYFVDDEVGVPSGQWTNKDELWDELVPTVRVEAVSLGIPVDTPRWSNEKGASATVNVRWGREDTGGLGDLVEFGAVYESREVGLAERYWPVLVETLPDGHGRVVAQMEPFDLVEGDFPTYQDQRSEAGRRAWEWVLTLGDAHE